MIEYKRPVKKDDDTKNLPKIKIIGIGGAGLNIIDRIAIEADSNIELCVMDTDIRTLNGSVCKKKIQFGKSLTQGLGTGGDPELGQQAVVETAKEISDYFNDVDMIFLCSGLGGGTSSGAVPHVAEIAQSSGAFVVSIILMPFTFEGNRRTEQAEIALGTIKTFSNALLTFDNDKMGELILARDGVQQAFGAADKLICQSIKSIVGMISPFNGLVNISVSDVLAALQNTDSDRKSTRLNSSH